MKSAKKGSAYISVSEHYDLVSYNEIEQGLMSKNIEEKEKNLRLLITNILNNDSYPEMILTVINYIMPAQSNNVNIKKMLFLYWEIIEKTNEDGSLKEELILVCNNFRNDLISANEYIAGRALKLLGNMMSREIIEPLVSTILDKNLHHTDNYVRRYAIVCLQKIWETFGDEFQTDFEQKIEVFLMKETDLTSRRNAYQLMFEVNKEKALKMIYESIQDGDIENFGDILQLIIVQMLRKTAKSDQKLAGRAIKYLKYFVDSKFNAVLYEVAISQIQLTNNPDTLRIAMGILQQLLKGNSDNNVKLIILDQLDHIRKLNPRMLEESFGELIMLLKSDSVDLKMQFLKFLECFLTSRNINKVIGTLQNELIDSFKDKSLLSQKYQSKLLSIIHRYLLLKVIPPMEIVLNTLPGILSQDIKNKSSFDTIRSIITYQLFKDSHEVKSNVLQLFLESLQIIEDRDLLMLCIYNLGRYLDTQKLAQELIFKLKSAAGPYPFELKDTKEPSKSSKKHEENEADAEPSRPAKKLVSKVVIRSDGTYGDEMVEVDDDEINKATDDDSKDTMIFNKVRNFLMKYEVFALCYCRALSRCLCQLDYNESSSRKNLADVIVLLCQLVQFYQQSCNRSVDSAFFTNISELIKALTDKTNFKNGNQTLGQLDDVQDPKYIIDFENDKFNLGLNKEEAEESAEAQIDELIFFRQLQGKNEVDVDIEVVAGGGINFEQEDEQNNYIQRLSKLVQLTGTSDPIYIEAFVYLNRFDTYLELVLINRTNEIFKNLSMSFFSVGDSESTNKTLDSIDNILLKDSATVNLYKTQKITPKDAMYIAANLTFENTRGEIVMNIMTSEITLEILDLIYPATISNYEFRNLWQKYNWENRIEVNTPFTDPVDFVDHVCSELKLKVVENLTPFADKKYLSANLYAKTYMGCDFLLNLSVEKEENCLKGHIRIRSEEKMVVVNIYKHLRQIQATKPKQKDEALLE